MLDVEWRNMLDLDRRSLMRLLGIALVELAAGCSSSRPPSRAAASSWLREIDHQCGQLRIGLISPREWQSAMETALEGADLKALLTELDFDQVVSNFNYPDLGVAMKRISRLENAFPGHSFVAKIFGAQRDRAIIPHGHRNMASAHLILNGEFGLRQFDKVSETESQMVIRQTVDEAAPIGSVSSISDEKNNVHWLRATTHRAYSLDLIVIDLADRPFEIHNIDPQAAQRISTTDLEVPKIDVEEALRKYGKSNWEFAI